MTRLALKNPTRRGGAAVIPAEAGVPAPVRGLYADSLQVARLLKPELPVFCFSPSALRARIGIFLEGFPGEVSYAVKANPGEGILLTACAGGVETFDVASVEEMATARAVAPRARLHYHNPIKSRAVIARALNEFCCTRFAADDPQEIAKIAAVAGARSGIEVAVRFRLPRMDQSVHDFSTKFGAAPEAAIALVKDVAARGFAPVLTFHPGSQCIEPEAYARHIAAASAIAAEAGVTLAALNVGGGFPASYSSSIGPDLADYFTAIGAAVARHFPPGRRPALECEPGRGLVAPAVSLLTRVKLVKPCRREVFLNDGIYGALMEASQVRDLMPRHRVIRDGRRLPAGSHAWTVYGPTCDPLDVLPGKLALSDDIAEDDFVEFAPVGAYGAATSTRFNGYGPGETVIVGETL
jgi:ornithine decarboxylase